MKVARILGFAAVFVAGLLGGGFLGVGGTTGPNADRQLHLFVDQYGQVQPDVTPHTSIYWTKLGGDGHSVVPVQDIKFKGTGKSPCVEGDPEQGVCTINVKDGWHAYDCPDSCADPTFPVGSKTNPKGGGGSGGGSSTGALRVPAATTVLAAYVGPEPATFRQKLKRDYFELAGSFDDALHAIWSGDDKPVLPYYPPPTEPARHMTFPTGPLARESIVCDASGNLGVPADQTLYSGGVTAPGPAVSVIWDSTGSIGDDWVIQDDAAGGLGLKDVCVKPPPYASSAESAGVCLLKPTASGTVEYDVVVKSGKCASTTPHVVKLEIAGAAH